MLYYYRDRGLSSIELIAKTFRDRKWYVPELICDEVVDKIKEFVENIEFYRINLDLSSQLPIPCFENDDPKIIYVIDYFGKEHSRREYLNPKLEVRNAVIIRDAVWFPFPFTEVKSNEIWFNSLRKIFRGSMGSSIVSPYRIGNDEVTGIFNHPSMTWREVDIRFRNYHFCKKHLQGYEVYSFIPKFPTVFPLRLDHRDEVLELAGLTGKLPGMWKNKHGLIHAYYKELTFIPIDSRFSIDDLSETIQKIIDARKQIK